MEWSSHPFDVGSTFCSKLIASTAASVVAVRWMLLLQARQLSAGWCCTSAAAECVKLQAARGQGNLIIRFFMKLKQM